MRHPSTSKADELLRELAAGFENDGPIVSADLWNRVCAYVNEPIKDAGGRCSSSQTKAGEPGQSVAPASPPHAAAEPRKCATCGETIAHCKCCGVFEPAPTHQDAPGVVECNHVRQYVPCEADVCLICGDWQPRAPTTDDAAERRIAELAYATQSNLDLPMPAAETIKAWMRVVYQAATEAAAKKCDALADGHPSAIARQCAAAIRGNK